jgi:large subunit ribosomal protein L23
MQDDNRYGFEVAPDATKSEIKAAVESLFNVTVLKVNVLNQDGKVKFRGRVRGKRKDVRKAYVRLAAGDTIQYANAA